MAAIPITSSIFDNEHWSFRGNIVTAVGGDALHFINWTDVLRVAAPHGTDLIIDGITIGVTILAGDEWRLQVTGYPNVAHLLGNGVAPAITPDTRSYFPLNLALLPAPTAQMITVSATFAQNDQAAITAWGHYRPTPATPQTIPVKVEELHIWPPKKKVGPV